MSALNELIEKNRKEAAELREKCALTKFGTDFFSRFIRDTSLKPGSGETEITGRWKIVYRSGASETAGRMAEHLRDFLGRCMGAGVKIAEGGHITGPDTILLSEDQDFGAEHDGAFSIDADTGRIVLAGADPGGLRDAVVRFVGLLGLRRAPYIKKGRTVFTPRTDIRLVNLQDISNDVFYGANSVFIGSCQLYDVSMSDTLPELAARRRPEVIGGLIANAEKAGGYGLKKYLHVGLMEKFDKDDVIFAKHPEIRGALTWKEDGQYALCTGHPLVMRFLDESIEGLFRQIKGLDGILIIIGGESFYHCFMRPYGVPKGHTNCARCEKAGAERTVADLCNNLAKAARRANPEAEVMAWPYSAGSVWSEDNAQISFIRMLDRGVSIMTEFEKDIAVLKPGGIRKLLWDYSIDLIGPGERAAAQLEAGRETGVPIHALTMAEMSFEAPLLPCVPVHDRWARRAEAIAASTAAGVYLWNMAPFNGLSSGELYQYFWFTPCPDKDEILERLAARICGDDRAGRLLREAWREASNGFGYTPVLPAYYYGPHYLGPAHPVVISREIEIPDIFRGYYLFLREISPESADTALPIYAASPGMIRDYTGPEGIPVLEVFYRVLESHLERAAGMVDEAEKHINERNRTVFEAETYPIKWFWHTARTVANMYEIFRIAGKDISSASADTSEMIGRLDHILRDEYDNAVQAEEIAAKDARIETLYRGDHSFGKLSDMLSAKIRLLQHQLDTVIPLLRQMPARELKGYLSWNANKQEKGKNGLWGGVDAGGIRNIEE